MRLCTSCIIYRNMQTDIWLVGADRHTLPPSLVQALEMSGAPGLQAYRLIYTPDDGPCNAQHYIQRWCTYLYSSDHPLRSRLILQNNPFHTYVGVWPTEENLVDMMLKYTGEMTVKSLGLSSLYICQLLEQYLCLVVALALARYEPWSPSLAATSWPDLSDPSLSLLY